jgi:phage tail sheath gpL-like
MPIAFPEIPANIRVPLFYADIQPAYTPVESPLRLLLVGARNDAGMEPGNAEDEVPYLCSQGVVRQLFGRGSMLLSMYNIARRNAPFAEIWGVSCPPISGGTPATATIHVLIVPHRNYTLNIMVGGIPVQVSVANLDSKQEIATRIISAINSNINQPFKAVINGSDDKLIDLTCRFSGLAGNSLRIHTKYHGGDNVAATELIAVTQPSGGTGSPSLTTVFGALGDQDFDVFAIGFEASAGILNACDSFMNHTSGRWSPHSQRYGHCVTTAIDSFADLVTFGNDRNGPHVTVLGVDETLTPQPAWYWTSALSARMTSHWASPPEVSRPLQTLHLIGLLPPASATNWFTIEERQALLTAGISTFRVAPDRRVLVDRECTTYKTNDYGDPDGSWRDANTMFQLMYFVRDMRATIQSTYPRAALSTREVGIPGFTSPGQIKDTIIHRYRSLESLGLVENSDLFADYLIVEKSFQDPNRVDCMMRPDVVNQFRIFAALIESTLEHDPLNPQNVV